MTIVLLLLWLGLLVGVSTIVLNFRFLQYGHAQILPSPSDLIEDQILVVGPSDFTATADNSDNNSDKPKEGRSSLSIHSVAGLSCADHGGPSDEIAAEMIYWKDIPSDSHFVSPYTSYGPDVKYLTVEPDEGSWNNKRMAMETAIALAVATGRILVLPPKQELVYDEIFDFASVKTEGNALQVITMEEFLTREALTGNLKDEKGNPVYPPDNKRVNWDGDMRQVWNGNVLWPYLRSVTTVLMWEKDQCVAVIPDKPGPLGEALIQEYVDQILKIENTPDLIRIEGYTGNPTPVNAPPVTRLREMMAHRQQVCVYNDRLQNAKYLHAMGNNQSNARLFSHFYALLFFEDWRHDVFIKRFIRDHFRYADDLQCAAARIVNELRGYAQQNVDSELIVADRKTNGEFDSFHVRRGDFLAFQKGSQVDALQIYKNAHSVLQDGATIYIATDEREKSFFDPLREHYKVYFLDDFQHLLGGIPMHKFGMLDQVSFHLYEVHNATLGIIPFSMVRQFITYLCSSLPREVEHSLGYSILLSLAMLIE